jgi:hypothetical protein
LLSHDQHFDNLDQAGREVMQKAKITFTTSVGATRLGGSEQVCRHGKPSILRDRTLSVFI